MKPHSIIFDFFGVICSDPSVLWFGRYFPPAEARRLRSRYCQELDSGAVSEKEWFETTAALAGKTAAEVRDEFKGLLNINDAVVECIKKLKASCAIGICSNTSGTYLRALLKERVLTGLFDGIVISSECGIIKPDPRIFRLAAEKLSVRPEEAVFIDDNPDNVEAARRVGMTGILFSSAEDLKEALSKCHARSL